MQKSRSKPSKAEADAAEAAKFHHREPRILHWDIESTALNASFGTILCIGYKFHGDKEKVKVPSILDFPHKHMLDDRKLVAHFAEVYEQCDYHTGWYSERFDLPMIRSKMVEYGMKPLPPKPQLDLWKWARKNGKLHSNRLAAWQEFLKTPNAKTPIDFLAWRHAALGNKSAMKDVIHHCHCDVLALEDIFKRIRPWLDNEPNRGMFTGEHDNCPTCGADALQRRGVQVTALRTFQRYQCLGCGRWTRSTRSIATGRLRACPS